VEGVDEEDEEEQQRFEEQLQQWRKTEVGGGDRGGVRVRVVMVVEARKRWRVVRRICGCSVHEGGECVCG